MTEDARGEKIQKVLAHAGVSSRRGAEEVIAAGRVKVNGRVVDDPAIRVDPDRDRIEVDGKPLPPPPKKPSGMILYKKPGYVTSRADPHNRRTVYDLLPAGERDPNRWIYAGRLDKDSEGLVLFTDSGELVHRLTHPSFKVEKRYRVTVSGNPSAEDLTRMRRGMTIEGRRMRAERVRRLGRADGGAGFELVLTQGEKRQIRKMFAEINCRVTRLVRTGFGPLDLEGLSPGESRKLTPAEMDALLRAAGRKSGGGK